MIQRRWPDTIFFAVVGISLLSWAAGLFHSTFFGAVIAAFFGLACLGMAVVGPASGPCPMCERTLHGLFALTVMPFERCPHCRRYFRPADRKEVPRDYVAATPQFAVPIAEGAALPPLCCVCSTPATRTQEAVYSSAGRVSHASPLVLKTAIKVQAPYCAAHEGGVMIVSEDFAPSVPLLESLSGAQRSDHRWVLKVRSYAFYVSAALK